MNWLTSPGRTSFRSSLLAQHPTAGLCGRSTKEAHHTLPGALRYVEMTERSTSETASQSKPKVRKFYIVNYSYGERWKDWEIENLDVLRMGGGALRPPPGRQGFPAYPEKPRLVIGKRKVGHPPRDIELYHSYWLVSDRLKLLFQSIDEQAFAFQACDVTFADGSAGPAYWLCDVVRVLEAFGEPMLGEIRSGRKQVGLLGAKTLIFNEDNIGNVHVFRTPYSVNVFCDQVLRGACKQEGIKGIRFVDCFHK